MDFVELCDQKKTIINEIVRLQKIADECFPLEKRSVITIQRAYRGTRCRHSINDKRWGSREIQRVFRGHLGRIAATAAKNKKLNLEYILPFHFYASQIQKVFLGYYSRKYIHNVSDHKNFVRKLIETNNEAKKRLNEHYESLMKSEEQAAEEIAERHFKQHAGNLHHLVSTSAIPGVYRHPYGGEETVLAIGAEEHIRSAVRDLLTQRRSREATSSKLKQTNDGVRDMKSLQSSCLYGLGHEVKLHEEMIHKLSTIGPSVFQAGNKAKQPHYSRGISDGTPFVDPWNHPLMKRGVENEADVNPNDAVRNAFCSSVGGNKSKACPNGLFDVIYNHSLTDGKKVAKTSSTVKYRRKPHAVKQKYNKDAHLVINLPPIDIADEFV